ncbi:MAG: metallophosphoesterase [Myxococcales bacterium]|nr:metallophosphoesterase [Myxococcales bacterium]
MHEDAHHAGGFLVHVAIGDPQAPLAKVLGVLAHHGLLAGERLRSEVQLVSIGDHFDWGPPEQREQATSEALALLQWLASHPPEQVILLAGNHDLARVCELSHFADDEAYAAARREADAAYRRGQVDAVKEAAFLRRYPFVPTAETLARDLSCFSVAQRECVTALLRSCRLRLAHAHGDLLLVHAGVTVEDLALLHPPLLSPPAHDARAIAASLNEFLDARVAAWDQGPLDLAPLQRSGDLAFGESRGVLSHRPVDPRHAQAAALDGPPRRRFDPRQLPEGVTQVIGHVRDGKCRTEMPQWCREPGRDGPLRSLSILPSDGGETVSYGLGTADQARLLFIDGGMYHVAIEAYELLDLDRVAALE